MAYDVEHGMNRRSFLQASAAGVTLVHQGVAASDRINVAMIGVRGQGRHLTGKFVQQKDVNVRYLCEVDENVFGIARWALGVDLSSEATGMGCKLHFDDVHPRNFLDCVRSRRAPNAGIEIGRHSTVLCHLGKIVARVNWATPKGAS